MNFMELINGAVKASADIVCRAVNYSTGYSLLEKNNIKYRARDEDFPMLCDFERRYRATSTRDGLPKPVYVGSWTDRNIVGLVGTAAGAALGAAAERAFNISQIFTDSAGGAPVVAATAILGMCAAKWAHTAHVYDKAVSERSEDVNYQSGIKIIPR